MSNLPIFDIAGSALKAQSVRMSTIASNLANADTVVLLITRLGRVQPVVPEMSKSV